MKKAKLRLPVESWGTLHTKSPASSIFVDSSDFTSGSKNWVTDAKGVITKRLGDTSFRTFTGTAKDQYEAIFSDGVHHLLVVAGGVLKYSSGSSFSDVTSGYSSSANFEFANYLDRVYFGNGIDNSQVYDRTASYGGVAYTVPKTKAMGAQAPGSALTATDNGAGNVAAGTYTYKTTFLYYDFEESNGGTASSPVTTAGSTSVSLTSIPVGGYGVTARKIYREISTTPGVWRLVVTVSNNTATTASDNTATSTSLIPDDNGVPTRFRYIVQHQERFFIAGLDGAPFEVDYSAAGLPDIFPADNFIEANSQDYVTGLVVYNGRIIVFNRNSFGQILGNSPDTYQYVQVPGNIGCVDNRTIQTRTINGVPILVWLSDKGFYSFNGSTVNYLSDPIEPDVNLNIQQATQITGQNVQTSQSDFAGGTVTPSVSTSLSPGDITQATPTRTWNEQAEWEETNAALTNIVSRSGSNAIKIPTRLAPLYETDGTHSNTRNNAGSLDMTVVSDFTGEELSGGIERQNLQANASNFNFIATSFTIPFAGVLTSVLFDITPLSSTNGQIFVWTDNSGVPGSQIFSRVISLTNSVNNHINESLSLSLSAGTYWYGIASLGGGARISKAYEGSTTTGGASKGGTSVLGPWYDVKYFTTVTFNRLGGVPGRYTFTKTPTAKLGQWTSQTQDTGSLSSTPTSITHTGSFPTTFGATNSSITYVEGSTDGVTFDVLQQFNSLNGTGVVALANRRYWRIRITLSTTDDRTTPTIGTALLKYPTTGTWISAPIDHTTDITTLDSLTMSFTATLGISSATLEIATSADNIIYSSFSDVSTATPQRYSKVKVTITSDVDNTYSLSVTTITLKWTIVGSLTSSAIDTAVVPAGWDIFSSVFSNGVTFQVRSASTSGGLSAATYSSIVSGAFPTITPLQFVQWKATLTSTASSVAVVNSVTVRWFVSSTSSLRAASIFYNKGYYVAVAELGQTANNVIFVFDQDMKWRIYRGISAATLSFFFNEPYLCSGTEGRLLKFLSGTTDNGTNISFDIRTKAFNFEAAEKRKVLTKVFIIGLGTGCTYTPTYSTDGGTTFKALVNSSGATTFTTTNDSLVFVERLTTRSADDYQGQNFIFRLTTEDDKLVELHEIQAQALIREGDIL